MSKIMVKTSKSLAYALLIILIGNPAFALETDSQEPLELKASSADINQSEHKGTYTNGVEFDQGTTHIRADRAITKTDENNKLTTAIIYGNKNSQAHYWSQMEKDKPDLHAYADIIEYSPDKKIIKLIGNAKIKQGENLFTAPKISYDIQKRHIISSKMANNSDKTVIIFHPPRKNND
jgi:lipopolysaccharide export system protein LptA